MIEQLDLPARYRPLGTTGIEVSSLAWGMWRFHDIASEPARVLIEAVLAAGITLFDTADIYGEHCGFGASEDLLGRVLGPAPALRDRIVLATKGGIRPGAPYDSSPGWLTNAIDGSLRRLHTDRIDLYQIHRPDLLTHVDDLVRTLEHAHAAGKIRAVGVSNYSHLQVTALADRLTLPLVSHQFEFSPLQTAPLFDGVLDQAMTRTMAVLAWSPFAGGRLATPQDGRNCAVAKLLDEAVVDTGATRAAAACAWLMAHPARPIPIIGTQNPTHIRAVAEACRVRWTRAAWYRVLETSLGQDLP